MDDVTFLSTQFPTEVMSYTTMNNAPFSHRENSTILITGVGLMGQHMARTAIKWLEPKQIILVDHATEIMVGTEKTALVDFASTLQSLSGGKTEVVAESLNIADEGEVADLFKRRQGIDYLQHTAGISPGPLTPPEQLDKDTVMKACEVNLWGAHNLLKQAVNAKAFTRKARGVLILSTSATVGSEGRASAAYEESKGGLMNLLTLQARHFLEKHSLILNGLAPSPLRGPMAAQNPISAGRLQAVEDSMPIGGLTAPEHITAATSFFWAEQCWAVGEVLTVDGGYTKHRPIYGPLA
jgi:NAD(P)-dependent dehydrogenase (short-subunit alcohol dehydrogenase family)